MDMATALAGLGVAEASLDLDTREQLDRDGYAPLPGVLSAGQVATIRARLAELLAAEGDQAGIEVHQEAGADRLADLVNKGPMFQPCFTHPRVLAGIAHVLGDFKLSSLNFRAALPGHGHQSLHADFGRPVPPLAIRCATRSGYSTTSPPTTAPPGWSPVRTGRSACPRGAARPRRRSPQRGPAHRACRHRRHLQQPPVARRDPEP